MLLHPYRGVTRRQVTQGGVVQVGALRGQRGANGASPLRMKDKNKSM